MLRTVLILLLLGLGARQAAGGELADSLRRALARPGLPDTVRVNALLALAATPSLSLGEIDKCLGQAAQLARRTHWRWGLARCYSAMAYNAYYAGDLNTATQRGQALLQLARQLHKPLALSTAYALLGEIALD